MRVLLLFLLAVAVAEPAMPPAPPPLAEIAWEFSPIGLSSLKTTAGTGPVARVSDVLRVDLTLYNADDSVLDTTYGRGLESMLPGSGQHHRHLELAVQGARVGDVILVRLETTKGAAPVRALVEVREIQRGRYPPDAPSVIAEADFVETPSGLRYHDLVVGPGPEATKGQRVVVDYTGWIAADGTMFDSSLSRNGPFSFTLGASEVVKGWDEGVAGMRVGGTRQLVIPAKLGYGKGGAPPRIPGDATLVFEVLLLDAR